MRSFRWRKACINCNPALRRLPSIRSVCRPIDAVGSKTVAAVGAAATPTPACRCTCSARYPFATAIRCSRSPTMKSRQAVSAHPLEYASSGCAIISRSVEQRVNCRRQDAFRKRHPRRARALVMRCRPHTPSISNAGCASHLRHVIASARQLRPLHSRPAVGVAVRDEASADGRQIRRRA
jgi:hypothetical protein